MKETIDLLGKIITNILTALYEPFGFSVLLSFLAMFFYLYAYESIGTGKGWKKILRYSGKIAFIFSVSIEMLQLLMRLGTFQLSDIFYNTVGGVLGGLMYCAVMKVRKRL